jgi:hypothetical protein
MIPRPEVIAIEKGAKISDFLALYAENPLSRFPVYQENMDNVIGILSVKDVLMAQAKGLISDDSTIDELVRPAYFAPETKRINELFAEMRDKNYRMCVVVDEFGGTAGIVSLSWPRWKRSTRSSTSTPSRLTAACALRKSMRKWAWSYLKVIMRPSPGSSSTSSGTYPGPMSS